jgi:hypothetical protein
MAPKENDAMRHVVPDGHAKTGADPSEENGIGTAASNAKADNTGSSGPETDYPTGLKLALLMTSIFVGMFLVSLVCDPNASII